MAWYIQVYSRSGSRNIHIWHTCMSCPVDGQWAEIVDRKCCGKLYDIYCIHSTIFSFPFGADVATKSVISPTAVALPAAAGGDCLSSLLSVTQKEREREWRKLEFLHFPSQAATVLSFWGPQPKIGRMDGRKEQELPLFFSLLIWGPYCLRDTIEGPKSRKLHVFH